MSLWLSMMLQVAATATPAPASPVLNAPPGGAVPQRFSILVDAVPPCPKTQDPGHDIVVCARANQEQKLPLPDEVTPDRPVASNPYMTGRGALAAESTPCAARQGGCQTGVDFFGAGTALVRLVQKVVAPSSCCEDPGEATNPVLLAKDAVHGTKHAFAKKADKSNRVEIPLDDPEPKGQILP